MIRVAVVDDQELTRDGFSLILQAQPDLEVIGSATDGAEAVALVRATAPDVVLMDVRMPVMDGVAATRHIADLVTGSKVLILTTFDLDEYVYAALQAGASGFLLKDAPRARLIEAVRCVYAGEMVLAPDVTRHLIEAFVAHGTVRPDPALDRLSPREAQTLTLVARGWPNAEIAASCSSVKPPSKPTWPASWRSSHCATESKQSSTPTSTASSLPAPKDDAETVRGSHPSGGPHPLTADEHNHRAAAPEFQRQSRSRSSR